MTVAVARKRGKAKGGTRGDAETRSKPYGNDGKHGNYGEKRPRAKPIDLSAQIALGERLKTLEARERYLDEALPLAVAEGWHDWIREYQDAVAAVNGCWMDVATGKKYVEFIETICVQSKGEWAGSPVKLMDWQRDRIVMPLFGWQRPAQAHHPQIDADLLRLNMEKRREGSTRRLRKSFIFLPKKNGKSTLASCVAICLLVLDQEPGAEVYCAATDRDQANIVWGEAANMIEASDDLSEVLSVHRHVHTINYGALRATLRALSSDKKGAGKEGLNWHGLIRDEYHVWTDRAFAGSLKYGGASRRQPLDFNITTAGDEEYSLCEDELQYAIKVRDGVIDDWEYHQCIYMADKDADWRDLEQYKKANPGWGVTVKVDALLRQIREAEHKPLEQAELKRYRLNLRQQRSNPWMTSEIWEACGRAGMKMEEMI